MSKYKITLVKSINNARDFQVATVRALGLRKIGCSTEKEDNPQIRGMIKVVSHLVKVEQI